MSIRAESGVCRFCGAVMLVSQMEKLEELKPAFDAYACPNCASDTPRKGKGRAS